MVYYNIIDWPKRQVDAIKTIHGMRLIPKSSLNILSTDSVRIAVSNCKRNSIIQLVGYSPNLGLVRKFSEKKGYLLFDLCDLLRAKPGAQRQKIMFNMSLLLKLCIKYKVDYVFSYVTDDEIYVLSLIHI